MSEIPTMEGMPALLDSDKNKVMHVGLPILAGFIINGNDNMETLGHHTTIGNNMTINFRYLGRNRAII